MKALQCLLLATLTLSISACQSNLPNIGTQPSSVPINSGITPSPKGPKPFPFAYEIPLGQFSSDTLALNRNLTGVPEATKQAQNGGITPTAPMAPPLASGQSQTAPAPAMPTGSGDTQADSSPRALVPTGSESPEPIESPQPEPSSQPSPHATASPESGQSKQVYLPFDDSASSANVEQTKYAFQQGVLPDSSWLRPWEFLAYESFQAGDQVPLGPFKISMGLWQHAIPGQMNVMGYDLGLQISGPQISLESRPNLVLTLLIDTSGSMNNTTGLRLDQTNSSLSLIDLAKEGLQSLSEQLKPGDTINLVSFSDQAKILLKNWTYTGNPQDFLNAVQQLQAEAGTNLSAGLQLAYALAQDQYDPQKSNRVLLLSDQASGHYEGRLLQDASQSQQAEGIYFSAIGLGASPSAPLLKSLTEAGKGSYASMITQQDSRRLLGKDFLSLLYTAAHNVRIRLDYPAEIKRLLAKSEPSSGEPTEVQSNQFGNNRRYFFLEQFKAEKELTQAQFALTITYVDPKTDMNHDKTLHFSVQELLNRNVESIKDAHLITLLCSLIQSKVSPDYARRELAETLNGHNTALATEYRNYIQNWLQKQ